MVAMVVLVLVILYNSPMAKTPPYKITHFIQNDNNSLETHALGDQSLKSIQTVIHCHYL